MHSRKKVIYILLCTIIIYFLFNLIYQKYIVKNKIKNIYVIKSDVKRGQKVAHDNLEIMSVNSNSMDDINGINNTNNTKYLTEKDIDKLDNKVFKFDFCSGQILSSDILIDQNEYIKSQNLTELISINIENAADAASYQITQGSIVNIYYTGKTLQASSIIDNMTNSNISSSSKTDGYTTVLLLEKVKIVGIYDKYGNTITSTSKAKTDSSIIDTILIETEKSNIIKIINLKKYGSFSVAIVS